MLSSDLTAPSSPAPAEYPSFSDDARTCPSSPPSSPPDLDAERRRLHLPNLEANTPVPTSSRPPHVSAFSVLGKRKAPLEPIADNVRRTKRAATAPIPQTATKAQPLTQLQISVGQEIHKRCKQCGMGYIVSSAEDRKLHDRYHKQSSEGYDVGKDFARKARPVIAPQPQRNAAPNAVRSALSADKVCVVDRTDPPWRRRRAREALEVAQQCLGAVDIPDARLWSVYAEDGEPMEDLQRYGVYLYLRGSKCIALALVERIRAARRTIHAAPSRRTESQPGEKRGGKSALERLRARRAETQSQDEDDAPVQIAADAVPAILGVSRIWTAPARQRQGVATALLDSALQHVNDGAAQQVAKDDVAFSQPTAAGTVLARKWFGRRTGWLVYTA